MNIKLLFGSLCFAAISSQTQAWQPATCVENSSQPACATVSPESLPQPFNFGQLNAKVVFGFGNDGCLLSSPVATISGQLQPNPGMPNEKPYDSKCAYNDQLDRAKVIVKEYKTEKNGNQYIVRIFGMYAVKDVGIITPTFGHKHEWEHALLYIKNKKVEYVGASQHTEVKRYPSQEVPHLLNQPNTFPLKYVMHKGTHDFSKYDGKKQDGQFVPKATNPTPNGKWFGEDNSVYIEYKEQPEQATLPSQYIAILKKWHNGGINLKVGNVDYINKWLPDSWKKDQVTFK
jgi:hypothetical protein